MTGMGGQPPQPPASRFMVTPDGLRHEFPGDAADDVMERAVRQHMGANAQVDIPTHTALGQLDASHASVAALQQQVEVGAAVIQRLDALLAGMQQLTAQLAQSQAAVSAVGQSVDMLQQVVAGAAQQIARAMVADREILPDANGRPARVRFTGGATG